MRIGVIGTGVVGNVLASALTGLGHEVRLGAREATNEKAAAWVAENGERASSGTFAGAAEFGELVICAIGGQHVLEALDAAGSTNLAGKTLIDASNPLDFSRGFPPTLSVSNDDSLGERIQRAHPDAHVVKAFNTMSNLVMVTPQAIGGGDHDFLICGNAAEAKAEVRRLLGELGWAEDHIIDLGGIDCARGMEMYLALWVRLMPVIGADFGLKFVRRSRSSV